MMQCELASLEQWTCALTWSYYAGHLVWASGFVFDLQLMRRKKLSDQLAIPLELLARQMGLPARQAF